MSSSPERCRVLQAAVRALQVAAAADDDSESQAADVAAALSAAGVAPSGEQSAGSITPLLARLQQVREWAMCSAVTLDGCKLLK